MDEPMSLPMPQPNEMYTARYGGGPLDGQTDRLVATADGMPVQNVGKQHGLQTAWYAWAGVTGQRSAPTYGYVFTMLE